MPRRRFSRYGRNGPPEDAAIQHADAAGTQRGRRKSSRRRYALNRVPNRKTVDGSLPGAGIRNRRATGAQAIEVETERPASPHTAEPPQIVGAALPAVFNASVRLPTGEFDEKRAIDQVADLIRRVRQARGRVRGPPPDTTAASGSAYG